jgi:hypothetical protein
LHAQICRLSGARLMLAVRRHNVESRDFDEFKKILARGDRATTAAAARTFVESFDSLEAKSLWVRWFLESENAGRYIRHEIYEGLVFPVLLAGYHEADPWSLRWLVRTAQNLYKSHRLWAQINCESERSLRIKLFELCPNDDTIRKELLESHLRSFRYMEHEWPVGILFGRDGASLEECTEIHAEIVQARKIDVERDHEEFIGAFEAKVLEYEARLRRGPGARGDA